MKGKIRIVVSLIVFFTALSLFPDRVFTQETCLVVLDVQEFSKKSKELDNSVNEMIRNVNSLISLFNAGNVIYIKSATLALNISFKGISVDTLPVPGFDSSLKIVSNNIFIKTEGDAFTVEQFDDFLKSENTKRIVLVGLMAEKCIYHTATGGKDRGYDIVVVSEGIVGMTEKKKDKAIRKMQDKGIEFISLDEITVRGIDGIKQ